MYTIPFPVNDMEELKAKSELEIDMSDLSKLAQYSKDPIKTALIYLRNIGFKNLKLNFSNCPVEMKDQYMILWLTSDIENDNEEFVNSWFDILIENKNVRGGMYTDEEMEHANSVLMKNYGYNIYEFAYSTPLYALSRLAEHQDVIDIDQFEKTDFDGFGPNIYRLVAEPAFDQLIDNQGKYAPKFYTKYFTMENNELFEALKDSAVMVIMYALMADKDNSCKELLKTFAPTKEA